MIKVPVSVIIPAKEEPDTISRVVSKALEFAKEVIVVLNPEDLLTIKALPRLGEVICYCSNSGKGNAMREGVRLASYDVVVFLDADGSHDPNQINFLTEPILDGSVDHVAGSRMLGGSSELFYTIPEFMRLIGNQMITLALNYKFKVKLTDSQNGFRAIKRTVFESLNTVSKHSTIEQEITTKCLEMGIRIMELPTHEFAREAGKSKISTYRDGYKHLVFLFKTLVKIRKYKNAEINNQFELTNKYFGAWK